MAKHTLRSRGDHYSKANNCIIPHNALMVYQYGFEYKRILKDGMFSRENYILPFEESTNEEVWEELE